MGIKTSDIKFQLDEGKRSEFDLITMLLILFAIGIIVGAILFIFNFRESRVAQLLDEKGTLSTIVVENNGKRTETVFLGFYNATSRKAVFITVPDITRLRADYEDKSAYDIIRNIYTKGGINVLRRTIEKLTNEHFDYYVVYDVKDAEKLVDLLEGVELDNPAGLSYMDTAKGVFIKVRKGFDRLDGAKARQLLLYKYGDSAQSSVVDIRKAFAEALLRRSKDIETVLEERKVFHRVFKTVKTNYNRKDMRVLARELKKMNGSQLLFYRMLGRNVVVGGEVYISPVENGEWLRERIGEVKKYLADQGPIPISDRINIEILNGSSNPGQALSLRNYLLEYGLNIVHFGNALKNDFEKTQVIDRVGQPALARRVADVINCDEVSTKVDATLMVDVSIIIGNDFEGQYVR